MGSMLVRHDASGPSAVRTTLAADLDGRGVSADSIDDVALVATELLGNAIRHGDLADGDDLDVFWDIDGDEVLIAVADASTAFPVSRAVLPDAECGRGLRIIEALSHAWGVETRPGGKRVWARVPISVA